MQFEFQTKTARAWLIDSGRLIDIGKNPLKKLPQEIRSLAPCAFLCKIEQVIHPLFELQFVNLIRNSYYEQSISTTCLHSNNVFFSFRLSRRSVRMRSKHWPSHWQVKYLTIAFVKPMNVGKCHWIPFLPFIDLIIFELICYYVAFVLCHDHTNIWNIWMQSNVLHWNLHDESIHVGFLWWNSKSNTVQIRCECVFCF